MGFRFKKDNNSNNIPLYSDKPRNVMAQIKGKFGIIILLLFILVIIYAITEAYNRYYTDKLQKKEDVIRAEYEKKNNSVLLSNENLWQYQTEKNIKDLKEEINKNSISVANDINRTNTNIDNLANNLKYFVNKTDTTINNINDTLTIIQDSIKNTNDTIDNKINTIKDDVTQYTDNKIKTFEINKDTPQLPQLNKDSKILPPPLVLNDTHREEVKKIENNKDKIEENITYEYYDIDVNDSNFSVRLDNNSINKKDENNTIIGEFDLLAGFSQATLLTGVNAKTLVSGTQNMKPVLLKLDTKTFSANGSIQNLKGCLIEATSIGNYTESRSELRLSKLTCTITKDGNKYKIEEKIKGWVYGEDSIDGLKGRLVTKEADIMKKGIPLAILESALSYLSHFKPNVNQATNAQDAFAIGSNASGDKIVSKMWDYYQKYLDNLNPYIEIKAGRLVTVIFAGGEKLKLVEYKNIDLDTLSMSSNEDAEDELW